jgi:hypothetical protein
LDFNQEYPRYREEDLERVCALECCHANFLCYNPVPKQEWKLAKKSKKKIARREYSKADVRELRAHSKARTPVDKIAKLTKRTVGSLRQKALKLGIGLGHQR